MDIHVANCDLLVAKEMGQYLLAKLIHIFDHEFLPVITPVNAMEVRTVDHVRESLYKWRYTIAFPLVRLHVVVFVRVSASD